MSKTFHDWISKWKVLFYWYQKWQNSSSYHIPKGQEKWSQKAEKSDLTWPREVKGQVRAGQLTWLASAWDSSFCPFIHRQVDVFWGLWIITDDPNLILIRKYQSFTKVTVENLFPYLKLSSLSMTKIQLEGLIFSLN